MLDKIKDLGVQVASKANDAVEGIAISVKGGVESLANTASTVNEKAVRTSTAQMCNILEIALEELKTRPLANRPVSLTATVNFGVGTLEMQVHLNPSEKRNESDFKATKQQQ